MSLSGTTNTYLPPTLDGLNIIDADAIYINGIPIDTENLVPYTGASKNVNLGIFNFQTLGSISAKQHILPLFGSTIMTSPTTSSIFYADAWKLNNTIQISSLGGGSFLSTSYLHITDVSNTSTLLTLQSDGIADFANTSVRVSTMATNEYDVVNLSTLTSAVAFIENVNALNYVPYTGATDNLNMGGSTITTTGLVSAGKLHITSSIGNADYALSVNSLDQLEFTNLSNDSVFKTNGADLFVSNAVNCQTLGATNVEAGTNIYLAKGSVAEWRTTYGMSDEYEILDNAGLMRMRLSKTTGMTISSLNITQVASATPSLCLGLNGGGQVVSFAVPTTSGLVPYVGATANLQLGTNNLIANTARFTGVISATPSLALGVDISGNLNTFTVPTATNLLPLNNVWTGFNTYNNSLQVAGGNMTCSLGVIAKQTATAGSLVQLTGGGAGNSPYLEFLFGGSSRGYIGNASAVDLDLVAQNGAKLNFYTAGTKRMEISTTGVITVPNDVVANGLIVNGGGAFIPGCIYSDANWGMLFRARIAGLAGAFVWFNSAGVERLRIADGGDITTSAPKFIATGTIGNINGGSNYAVGAGYMATGSLTLGDHTKSYGGGSSWNSNTAGLLFECAVNTEIAVHDGGDRIASFMYYSGNTFTIGRDMGWGQSYVGIGITPSYKLHVGGADGNIRAEGAIYCDNYFSANPARQIILNDANAVNYITNNTGTKPISFNPGTWANGGYTVISQAQGVNSPGLGLGTSSYGGNYSRSVVIGLNPGLQWGELILSSGTVYTSCFGSVNNYTNGGGWVYISDKRCKKDIKDIKTVRSLERIMALKPKTYKKIYPENSETPIAQKVRNADHIGFLAQDVMETNPHCVDEWVDDNAVSDGDDGKRLGISYGDINIHMVGAIQEIVKQSTSQATLVQELKKQNDAQQKEIDDLRQYKTLSDERFEKMGRLIADQNKMMEFLMAKLK